MLSFIININYLILILFTGLYAYQMFYTLVALYNRFIRRNKKDYVPKKLHRFAVCISARNEQAVIGHLIKSIKGQKYPGELVDVFVVADNCTDDTAGTARAAGATVFERSNRQAVGKGYALNYLFQMIEKQHPGEYEGYMVFDADNLLDENYIAEMNKVFDQGYKVITSYRNSKNYDSNWISAGYALWFLRESEYLNNPRMLLKTSCTISGTGFCVNGDIIRANGGWKHHLLTEDIEFSIDSVINGELIGYCGKAMLYDEQPVTFSQSWTQRLRWSKGFYQVFGKYGFKLFKQLFDKKRRRFSNYDMLMTIMPLMLVSIFSLGINILFLLYGNANSFVLVNMLAGYALKSSIMNFYIMIYIMGLLTTITEWKRIHCSTIKKIIFTFTFPVYIFTNLPISVVALFKKVEWKPIVHSVSKSLNEVR